MDSYYVIDSHCDTLGIITDYGMEAFENAECHVSIKGLKQGRVGLQFFAAWVGPKNKYHPCLQRGLKLIDAYYTMLHTYQHTLMPILKPGDMDLARAKNMIGTLLTVEGGDILEGELVNLRILYKLGVRAMTLTWNYRNEIADGALENTTGGGLSLFGYEVVQEMNRLGILIDVSHLSEKGFDAVIRASIHPITATHSNAWSIHPHPRNLKDDQIRMLAKHKGVMGINFYPAFLSEKPASLDDILRHIEYIAALVGVDVIGFGSDFDGIETTPIGVRGPENYGEIINGLLKLNYSEVDVKKIAFANYIRLLENVL